MLIIREKHAPQRSPAGVKMLTTAATAIATRSSAPALAVWRFQSPVTSRGNLSLSSSRRTRPASARTYWRKNFLHVRQGHEYQWHREPDIGHLWPLCLRHYQQPHNRQDSSHSQGMAAEAPWKPVYGGVSWTPSTTMSAVKTRLSRTPSILPSAST